MGFGSVEVSNTLAQAVSQNADTTGAASLNKTAALGSPQSTSASLPPQQLLQTHREIGSKLEAFVKDTPSEAQSSAQAAPSDSFSAENLKKLRDMSSSSQTASAPTTSGSTATQNLASTLGQSKPSAPTAPTPTQPVNLNDQVNVKDILKGVAPQKELDQAQKLLNETAARQKIEVSAADKGTVWAKNVLRQEALPYKTVRQQAPERQTFIPKLNTNSPFAHSGKSAPATPLVTTPLQNPNAPGNLQATSSKLIMDQLSKSPFKEGSPNAKGAEQAAPKLVFASTFTPVKGGQIPLLPSINTSPAAAPLPEAPTITPSATPALNPQALTGAAPALNPGLVAQQQAAQNLLTNPNSAILQNAQMNALAANSTTVQRSNIKEKESADIAITKERLRLGLSFGGRPTNSQVPVYSPTLDAMYQPRSKKELDKHSTPIKMALSGSVGSLNPDTYGRPQWSGSAGAQAAPSLTQENLRKLNQARELSADYQPVGLNTPVAKRISLFAERNPLQEQALPQGEGEGGSASYLYDDHKPKLDASGRLILSLNDMIHLSNIRLASSGSAFDSVMQNLDKRASDRQYALERDHQAVSQMPSAMLKQIYASQTASPDAQTEAINGAILMLKLSGEETYTHSTRIVDLALDVAAELGIRDEKGRQKVEYGAMFKDIGETDLLFQQEPEEKQEAISLYMASDEYRQDLASQGLEAFQPPVWMQQEVRPLAPEEYEQLRRHPQHSEEMLYPLLSLRFVCPVVRAHHERWDGKGFPDGLAGEKIPLPARIIAVCDAYDALVHSRNQGRAHTPTQACEIIKGGRGSAFDPRCVEAFLKVIERRNPQGIQRSSSFRPRRP